MSLSLGIYELLIVTLLCLFLFALIAGAILVAVALNRSQRSTTQRLDALEEENRRLRSKLEDAEKRA